MAGLKDLPFVRIGFGQSVIEGEIKKKTITWLDLIVFYYLSLLLKKFKTNPVFIRFGLFNSKPSSWSLKSGERKLIS